MHGLDRATQERTEDAGGTTTAFISRVAPGAMTPPPHSHEGWDETVYCTEGTMTYIVDGTERALAQGDALCVRRGQVHKFENRTSEDAWMLVVSTPGLFHEEYFLQIADISTPTALPTSRRSSPSNLGTA